MPRRDSRDIATDNPQAASDVVRRIFSKVRLLCEHPRLGQRYEPISDREVRETFYGHSRIGSLIVNETRIEVLGVFHASMDIERYLH